MPARAQEVRRHLRPPVPREDALSRALEGVRWDILRRMKRNLEPYDNIVEVVGWTPLVRLRRIGRGIRTPIYGKAENLNPAGRSRTGSASRSSRPPSARRAQARRRRGRGDERATPASGSRSPRRSRVPLHLHDPGQDVDREDPAAAGLRGRGDRDADGVPPDHPDYYVTVGEDDSWRDAGRDLREPVLQPRQPEGALRDDRSRALGADEGQDHGASCARPGHRRHDDGRLHAS